MKCFEFEITYRCNTVCEYCNRLLGVVHLPDSDLTPDQTRYAIRKLRHAGYIPDKIKLSGGEPRVNPHLDKIRDLIKKRLAPKWIWTLTNGKPDSPAIPLKPIPGNQWRANPLPKQNHDPFLISPVDAGMDHLAEIEKCTIQRRCGRAFDAHGFSFCPLAPMIGRLLRINPYKPTFSNEKDHRICRHCPHSLPEPIQPQLFQIALDGNYPSKTFKEGLKAYKEEPLIFPRLE